MSSSPTEQRALVRVEMPKMGISVSEGTILEWRKQPGRLGRGRRDDRRRDDRQGRRRDPRPRPAAGSRGSSPSRATRCPSARRSPRSTRRRRAGEAHPGRAHAATEAATPRRRERVPDRSRFYLAGGRADRRQAPGRPRSGRGDRHRRPGAEEGRARATSSRAGQRSARRRPAPVLHTESPYKPEPGEPTPEPKPAADGERREPMTPMRLGDRQAHARVAGARRRTARRSSRSTCRGWRPGGPSSRSRWPAEGCGSPTSPSSPRRRSRRSAITRSSTPRSRARRSSTTTTSTSGSRSRSTTG